MPETFFEPGKRSHCVFSPDLWCDKFDHASATGGFEFMCNLQPQTVGVVLPSPEGEAGEIWERIYQRIAAVWEARDVGFRCFRVDARSWIDPRPCAACEIAREAQVVVLELNGADPRALAFLEMARSSELSLNALQELPGGHVPRKRAILISCGPVKLPLHYQRVFNWIDYAGATGEPDLDRLSERLEAVAREMELFQIEETMQFHEQDFAGEPAGGSAPADLSVEEIERMVTILEDQGIAATTKAAPLPAGPSADPLAEPERLVRAGSFAAALRALQVADRALTAERRPRARQLAAQCVERMSAVETVTAFFAPAGPEAPRLSLGPWRQGRFAVSSLAIGDAALRKQLGAETIPLHVCARLAAADAEALAREVAPQPGQAGTAVVVVAECDEAAGRCLAGLREAGLRLIEVRLADLQAAELEHPRAADYLRRRLAAAYERPADLFLQRMNSLACRPDDFFGRAALLETLGEQVRAGEGFGLYGLPRSGKSSLLCRLAHLAAAEGVLLVHVDLQRLASASLTDLYRHVASALRRTLEVRYPHAADLDLDELRVFSLPAAAPPARLGGCLAEALDEVTSRLQEQPQLGFARMVLVFDEVERVLPDRPRGAAGVAGATGFLEELRLASDRGAAVGVAGLGSAPMRELDAADSPLGGGLGMRPLGPLEPGECDEMVRTIGRRMYAYFADEGLSAIRAASGCDPRLTKVLCSLVLEVRGATSGLIGPDPVNRAVQVFLRSPGLCAKLARIFQTFRRCWPDEAELLRLTAEGRKRGEAADAGWLDSRVRLGTTLPGVLRNLCAYGLLAEVETGRYVLPIGLLHDWLRQESGP